MERACKGCDPLDILEQHYLVRQDYHAIEDVLMCLLLVGEEILLLKEEMSAASVQEN